VPSTSTGLPVAVSTGPPSWSLDVAFTVNVLVDRL
jgi:hypothetical protein